MSSAEMIDIRFFIRWQASLAREKAARRKAHSGYEACVRAHVQHRVLRLGDYRRRRGREEPPKESA